MQHVENECLYFFITVPLLLKRSKMVANHVEIFLRLKTVRMLVQYVLVEFVTEWYKACQTAHFYHML